jgi:hypothetical protein
MSDRDEGRIRLSPDDEVFVRRVAAAYAAPPMTGPRRARFEARLDERLAGGLSRAGPWLVAATVCAGLLALVMWRAPLSLRGAASAPDAASVASAASSEEVILALATLPAADADEALPDDYRVISDLLAGD